MPTKLSEGKLRITKEESSCEEKDGEEASDTGHENTLKEHLETFHVTERAKDKMLALISYKGRLQFPRWMKDALSLFVS